VATLPPIYIVGAGNVGLGLALALRASGADRITLWTRSPARRQTAEALWHSPVDGPDFGPALETAGLVLLCVTDSAIATTAQALVAAPNFPRETTLVHTAGSLPAHVLPELPDVPRGSLHPVLACPTPERTAVLLANSATFALEGDAAAIALLRPMVDALGGKSFELDANQKPHYHAAAVMASNLVMALLDLTLAELEAAGASAAAPALLEMAARAVAEAQALGVRQALTGPVLRGDVQTVRSHLSALGASGMTYRALSRQALVIARERGLGSDQAATLQLLLREDPISRGQ
jgi:predicted short-subunit dehydrogenase-like oxidoreductase (DUF2520 family)